MRKITGISNDTKQKRSFLLDDGTLFTFVMYFSPLQQGWFITSFVYGDFVLNGLRICNSPNMLYQWKNILPFGLACQSNENREPGLQEDFQTDSSRLFVLSEAEVEEYSDFLSGN